MNKFNSKMKFNIRISILLFCYTFLFFFNFKLVSSENIISVPRIKPIQPITRKDILSYVKGTTYYLDANKGNDKTGDGSSGKPWKTISKAQSIVKGGDAVIIRNGNYGIFNDDVYTSSKTNWTVYINEEGATPEFTSIDFSHSHGPSLLLKLIFYGIKIAPKWVNPGIADSMVANSTGKTYTKSSDPVYIGYRSSIRFYNCEIVGTNKYLTTEAIYLTNVDDIIFERCHIHKAGEGIVYTRSSNITMDYNYIHEVCASFFKDGYVGNSYIRIEGNHAHNAGYRLTDPYCPKASGANYHGSMMALNNSNTIVRNNFLHGGGGTNAICFYTDGNPVYSNVLIENNLVYNPTATTCVDVEQVADNVVIRNNILIGQKRNENFGEYMYNNAIYVGSYASGYNGSGLNIYNNIFIGRAVFKVNSTYVNKDFNITYYGDDFATKNSKIALNIHNPSYFESGFFNGALNIQRSSIPDQVLDLTFAADSPGINFGDPNNQSNDSLGTLDPSGFIIPNGTLRDINHHSAGCYEKN
jgi:hypothetical protein